MAFPSPSPACRAREGRLATIPCPAARVPAATAGAASPAASGRPNGATDLPVNPGERMREWIQCSGGAVGRIVLPLVGFLTMFVPYAAAGDEHVLLSQRELLAVETAAPDVVVLVFR